MPSELRRHRHPDYPDSRCGVMVVIRSDGRFQQYGAVRRKCCGCRRQLKPADLR